MGKFFGLIFVAIFVWFSFFGEEFDPSEPRRESSGTDVEAPEADAPDVSTPVSPPAAWRVSEWTSAMDDSTAVSLLSESEGVYTGAYGGPPGRASLYLRCLENTTNLYIKLNGHFLADIQSYGAVTYRIDDQKARTMRMRESTDNKALGLWSGGEAIPVIRRFFGHDEVVMRVTPFNQSSTTVTFPIHGLEEAIRPLRSACNW